MPPPVYLHETPTPKIALWRETKKGAWIVSKKEHVGTGNAFGIVKTLSPLPTKVPIGSWSIWDSRKGWITDASGFFYPAPQPDIKSEVGSGLGTLPEEDEKGEIDISDYERRTGLKSSVMLYKQLIKHEHKELLSRRGSIYQELRAVPPDAEEIDSFLTSVQEIITDACPTHYFKSDGIENVTVLCRRDLFDTMFKRSFFKDAVVSLGVVRFDLLPEDIGNIFGDIEIKYHDEDSADFSLSLSGIQATYLVGFQKLLLKLDFSS